jgi:beta-galactosidase/beta-glucuronidase
MKTKILWCMLILTGTAAPALAERVTLNLNGTWEFDQTQTAFPPQRFTRRIPVPGLIHLAQPRIDQYDQLFLIDTDNVTGVSGNPYTAPYRPRYNWYRRTVTVDAALKGQQATLTIMKSKYVTEVFVNGLKVGSSMACYTPVDCDVTRALRYGAENEILISVGDRAWLPSAAAGSTDKEKVNYLPGIWDDVTLSFTGPFRIHRTLLLPSIQEQKVTAKLLVHNFYLAQIEYGDPKEDTCRLAIQLVERKSGRSIGRPVTAEARIIRDRRSEVIVEVPVPDPHLWTPDDPFLYEARITLYEKNQDGDRLSDTVTTRFGMRTFGRDGRHFTLNGKKIMLRGTNITLHRFFEDPDCQALPWDRAWVQKLMGEIPKQVHWNAMRVCVGIAPTFWYEIADEYGLLLQNEWLYWQTHGWDEQIRQEYTDWVWTDGSHPSIVIWDAINENWDTYIGNQLIPELQRLDPTRLWDAGYMTGSDMGRDEMDEPHPYRAAGHAPYQDYVKQQKRSPYALGDLENWFPGQWQTSEKFRQLLYSSAAQLVNEYGWVWLWRDGRPAKLTHNQYNYFVGAGADARANRAFQAYWLQLETEWLRTERSLAGVLSFCYLTNNYGHTGDWFIGDIKDLEQGPTLQWFQHCFAPAAVFIDLTDERYTQHMPLHAPGATLVFNLIGVNDEAKAITGSVTLALRDARGQVVSEAVIRDMVIPAYHKSTLPHAQVLPSKPGGYLLTAAFRSSPHSPPVISRRYLKVGNDTTDYAFYDEP